MGCCMKSTDCKLTVVDAKRCRAGISVPWQALSCKFIKRFIEPRILKTASSSEWIISNSSVSILGAICSKHTIASLGMLPKLVIPLRCKRFKRGNPPKFFSISHFAELSSLKSCILSRRYCNFGKYPLVDLQCVRRHMSLNFVSLPHPIRQSVQFS